MLRLVHIFFGRRAKLFWIHCFCQWILTTNANTLKSSTSNELRLRLLWSMTINNLLVYVVCVDRGLNVRGKYAHRRFLILWFCDFFRETNNLVWNLKFENLKIKRLLYFEIYLIVMYYILITFKFAATESWEGCAIWEEHQIDSGTCPNSPYPNA